MRRRIWQVIDALDAEILRFAQNDIEGHFFSNLLDQTDPIPIEQLRLTCQTKLAQSVGKGQGSH